MMLSCIFTVGILCVALMYAQIVLIVDNTIVLLPYWSVEIGMFVAREPGHDEREIESRRSKG